MASRLSNESTVPVIVNPLGRSQIAADTASHVHLFVLAFGIAAIGVGAFLMGYYRMAHMSYFITGAGLASVGLVVLIFAASCCSKKPGETATPIRTQRSQTQGELDAPFDVSPYTSDDDRQDAPLSVSPFSARELEEMLTRDARLSSTFSGGSSLEEAGDSLINRPVEMNDLDQFKKKGKREKIEFLRNLKVDPDTIDDSRRVNFMGRMLDSYHRDKMSHDLHRTADQQKLEDLPEEIAVAFSKFPFSVAHMFIIKYYADERPESRAEYLRLTKQIHSKMSRFGRGCLKAQLERVDRQNFREFIGHFPETGQTQT